jgi:ubiquinone/menaquinone biosynthesis C-methylase UbiE
VERRPDLLAEQLRYYRARAAEYDRTSFGVHTGERRAVPGVVDRLAPRGDVAELACGTGVWTVELARHATTLTAVDAAPEMLRLARRRAAGLDVRFVLADVYRWAPRRPFDVVFFAFWLSHVPTVQFAAFWAVVARALRPGGRALFVDELPSRAAHETFIDHEIVRRTLRGGSVHRVVKVFHEPSRLAGSLADLGWHATVTPIQHDWFVGSAVRRADS